MRAQRKVEAERIGFLMAEIVRANFRDPGERRWRMLAALAVLNGQSKPSARDMAMVDRELGK